MTFLRHRRDSTSETPPLLYALQATIFKERAKVGRSKSARTVKVI
ncbi:hypothetical protein ATPR_1452 [Acetobacter tropicalis NBRC 101654]|uniref:Uncharacterized protein n=1 Tax=Acetobacter tropicalis NBRC 101654 TaxID=749388 RepID=F7VDK3_9PROT|nr:hypothetical protein ATPR_1452 [Acetobacter tropicalis NBRC 101654]